MKDIHSVLRARKRTGKDTVDSRWLTDQAIQRETTGQALSMKLLQEKAIAPVAGKFLLYHIIL